MKPSCGIFTTCHNAMINHELLVYTPYTSTFFQLPNDSVASNSIQMLSTGLPVGHIILSQHLNFIQTNIHRAILFPETMSMHRHIPTSLFLSTLPSTSCFLDVHVVLYLILFNFLTGLFAYSTVLLIFSLHP